MRILSLNTHDQFGGAEVVQETLRKGVRQRGGVMMVVVGQRHADDLEVISIGENDHLSGWPSICRRLMEWGRPHIPLLWKGYYKQALGKCLAHPIKYLRHALGHEDFEFPTSRRLLELIPESPDLIHAHNLNGDYFDLRFLEKLSNQFPVLITLHDHWWLTGHCAHPMDCERWRKGCGSCPDLTIFPAIARDATAYNFRRKECLVKKSRLYAVAPSRWLAARVSTSAIGRRFKECRVIPNGVDLDVFNVGAKDGARGRLGLPQGKLVLFVAREPKTNLFKDYALLKKVLRAVAAQSGPWTLVVVGASYAEEEKDGVRIIYRDGKTAQMPDYYRACDFLVHPAKAETFPTVILESMACGRAVIASEVGGIPEQIIGWEELVSRPEANGILVPVGSEEALSTAMIRLFSDEALLEVLGKNARAYAERYFDQRKMVDAYFSWYQELIAAHGI